MRRIVFILGSSALALTSTLALAGGPEDLLPPAFRDPPPQATPTPAPRPSPTAARPATPTQQPGSAPNAPVVQQLPDNYSERSSGGGFTLPADFPSLEELEAMEESEINELFGLRPRFDIPAAARRSLRQVGVLAAPEGGFPSGSLARQPAALVRAALAASDGPVVSRWGHILLRRALASRLDPPRGMNPVEFAALRAKALVGMGEGAVARALVQDVDGNNYNRALTDAAFDAYLATGDVLGMCPVARLQSDVREDGEWELLQAICSAYLGESRSAERALNRALGTGLAPEIDVRLAQRYAGAAGDGGRAVNIEWDGTDELTPWRFGLARALGATIPDQLRDGAPVRFDYSDIFIPATPLDRRVRASDAAAARGILSSSAMVDLYSQLWASDAYEPSEKRDAVLLREAYVADTASQRLAAMQQLWEGDNTYGRQVLTAYAAARLPVTDGLRDEADAIIASMLTAGLDANALRWSSVTREGSEAWALLALAQPSQNGTVDRGSIDAFIDDDDSDEMRKSAFLLAGLAGLGRVAPGDLSDFADRVGVNFARSSPWSEKITRAASLGNTTLVALLAGLGMQGTSWEQMTPRQLYYIVSALERVGLSAEARMIAVEAVTRG